MKNTNNKKPKLIAIIIVALVLVLAIGVGIWASGIQSNPEPSDPTGSSGTEPSNTDGTEPSNTDGTEPSGTDASDPTESGSSDGNETTPSGEPTDPSGTQPEATTPTETQPQATTPTESQPAETDPTNNDSSDGGETAPTAAPTEEPTEAPTQKPTEPPVTEPPVTEPPATEPKPTEPAITWEKVNETVYATGNVNVRTGPGTSYDKLGQLKTGEAVKRVAIGSNGWSKVEYNGKEAYISSNYLTREEPVKPTDPPATEPKPTDPPATEPKPTDPPVTEPPATEADKDEVMVTMYVTKDTEYRIGPGTEYAVASSISAGTPVAVAQGSEINGWVKIYNASDYYYIRLDCLTETRPGSETEPTKDPDDPWASYKQPADPETGISWDGVSPIIYTYPDGTTGTEPKDGAEYEFMPGIIYVWTAPSDPYDDPLYYDGEWHCENCGKVLGYGTNGTCGQHIMSSNCYVCGEYVQAGECHYCDEEYWD